MKIHQAFGPRGSHKKSEASTILHLSFWLRSHEYWCYTATWPGNPGTQNVMVIRERLKIIELNEESSTLMRNYQNIDFARAMGKHNEHDPHLVSVGLP